MDIKDDVTIQSWDGTWTYRPKVLVTPETPDDIVEIEGTFYAPKVGK